MTQRRILAAITKTSAAQIQKAIDRFKESNAELKDIKIETKDGVPQLVLVVEV